MPPFKMIPPTFEDEALNAFLIELQRRIAASGGFTPGGDLEGNSVEQIVAAIRTMPTPEASTASPRDFLRVSSGIGGSPRSCVASGGLVWVGQHTQDQSPGSGVVLVVDATTLEVVAQIDLAAILPGVDTNGVRDMAQDDNYVYCACWQTGNVAIISKATNAVVGWGAVQVFGSPYRQITSVCADNLGNFYAIGYDSLENYALWRFSTAACVLANAPDTVGPVAAQNITRERKVRYGAGALFTANGGSSAHCMHRYNPNTLAETGTFDAPGGVSQFGMDCLVAFGSVWVTNNDKNVQGLYRVDPATMALQATVDCTAIVDHNLNCIGVGPSNTGAAAMRLLVTNVDSTEAMIVVDPAVNAIETTVDIPNVGAEQVCAWGNRFFVASPKAGGPNASLYAIEGAASAYTVIPFPLRLVYDDGSSSLPYVWSCNGPNPWQFPGPGNVGAAIDWLAQAVAGLLGGPIPPCGGIIPV